MIRKRKRRVTLELDRRFAGVGRIKKATGTTIPAVKRKLSRMLDDLMDDGRLDLLKAIKDGHLTMLEVYDARRRRMLDRLAVGPTVRPLSKALDAWIKKLRTPQDYSKKHIDSFRTTRAYCADVAPQARVADLADVLEKLRDTLGREHPRSFNVARSCAMAFVRKTLKRNHPLWLAVAAVEPRKVTKQQPHRPLTPDQMRNWFPDPATDPLDAIAWGMVTTGMYASEYWGTWEVRADRVHIRGTKRKGRVRDVPLVLAPAVPAWQHRRTFEDALRARTDAFTPIDLRRTYATWLESAGIPRTRRRMYLGHGAKDVTDLYEQHEVTAFLTEDAGKLRRFLTLDEAAAPKLRAMK